MSAEVEEDVSIIFINKETGEEYRVDSAELQASVVPYVIYIIGSLALRAAIKQIGKKTILRIGKKQFIAKSKDAAEKAAKKALTNFKAQTINVGSKKVKITEDRMEHIISKASSKVLEWHCKIKKNNLFLILTYQSMI